MWRWLAVALLAGGELMPGEVRPALAVDASGTMVTVWGPGTELVVKRWRGGRWEDLGVVGQGWAPSVQLDRAGNPLVAWQDRTTGNDEIFFRRWDGRAWGPAENVSQTNTGGSRNPSLALDQAGRPVVAWEEQYGARADVWVRRRERRGWQDWGKHPGMYRFPEKMSAASFVALRLDGEGRPVVAWLDNAEGNLQVYVRRWERGAWVELGGSGRGLGVSQAKGGAASVDLLLDGPGAPVVSWSEGRTVRVKRWNGAAWEGLGASSGEGDWPRLTLGKDGQVVLAMRGVGSVRVLRWTGVDWTVVGDAKWEHPGDAASGDRRQLALAAAADKACVAWVENTKVTELRTACFTLGA